MYFVPLFAVPPLDDADVAGVLAVARDADVDAPARVAALHRLRGVPAGRRLEVARGLVDVLNDAGPDAYWLGSEALQCLHALAPDVGIGERDAVLVASPTEPGALVDDGAVLHCPALGVVAWPMELGAAGRPGSRGATARLPLLQVRAHFGLVLRVDGRRRIARSNAELTLSQHAKLVAHGAGYVFVGEANLDGRPLLQHQPRQLLPYRKPIVTVDGHEIVLVEALATVRHDEEGGVGVVIAGVPVAEGHLHTGFGGAAAFTRPVRGHVASCGGAAAGIGVVAVAVRGAVAAGRIRPRPGGEHHVETRCGAFVAHAWGGASYQLTLR